MLPLLALIIALLPDCRGTRGEPPTLSTPNIVDLTYPFGADTVYWPGGASFQFKTIVKGPFHNIPWMEMNNFSAPEHGGTHFDAPAHFGKGKWHVDDIPVQRLVGPAVVIDIAWRARNDFDTQVRPQDLLDWEATHGRIPAGAIILMRSGWGANWPNKEQYFGSRTWNDTKTFHFPGIHVDAAKWLLANRAFVGVSVDTPSIDYGQSSHFLTHQTLLNENIYAMENVANMEKLPASGATVFVMPMLIQSGSGAPCRIVGILPDSPVGNTAAAAGFNNHTSTRMVVIVTLLFLALARKYS